VTTQIADRVEVQAQEKGLGPVGTKESKRRKEKPIHFGANDAAILAALQIPGWFELRVMSKVRIDESGCWIWTASKRRRGYGRVHLPESLGHLDGASHRVVWLALRGAIPENHVLDHDGPTGCHRHDCVNPDHMQVATCRTNVVVTGTGFAAINARKTSCMRGHPFNEENTVRLRSGGRGCRPCRREYDRTRALAS